MTRTKKIERPFRNPGTVNKLAAKIIEEQQVNLAGIGYSLAWMVEESLNNDLREALLDAVSPDWRDAKKEARKLYEKISKKAPEIGDHDDLQVTELCATQEAWFALGWAAAVRLLGK